MDARKTGASHPRSATPKSAPRFPGRPNFNRQTLTRRSWPPGLKDDLLGGRYGYRPGFHRLWDHPQEVDLQKPVLQAGAFDLDMVGELKVAFEIPLRNALVDQVARYDVSPEAVGVVLRLAPLKPQCE
jgi:hypothetical protein